MGCKQASKDKTRGVFIVLSIEYYVKVDALYRAGTIASQRLKTNTNTHPYLLVRNRIPKPLQRALATALAQHKKTIVHGLFLALVLATVWQSRVLAGVSNDSLLYALISGEEVSEGPLDKTAYAQTDAPGIGGARLAAIDAGLGVDVITFDDAEVAFSATLGGNTVIAPLTPVVPEPGSADEQPRSDTPRIYTVESGDTIASIAAAFDVSTNTVLWANGLSARDTLTVGDHLTILPTTGVLHTVRSGDTLLAIAQRYDVDALEIKDYNQLADSHTLAVGQKLIIPDGSIAPVRAPRIVPGGSGLAGRTPDGPTPAPAKASGTGMVWPTTTRHLSQTMRWGHTGIDIDNRSRPPIYASLGGTIEFAGWLGSYGNLIIINHGNGMQTYYAHLEKFYVGKGATVAKGAAIGKMGSTGRSTGPHLHFEVRINGRPQNPLNYVS